MAERSTRYRRLHPERSRASRRRTQLSYKRRKAQWLRDLKYGQPCADCGGLFDPVCMDFDHRDPSTKSGNVSSMKSNSIAVILAEVAKCDLICANCHRLRTRGREHYG